MVTGSYGSYDLVQLPEPPPDVEKLKALREPFPAEQVGKLPKGGVDLDYVGHGAVTDRLLKVDPFWSWEPLALDPNGLPALDDEGNLWIKLTVNGVTRLGVGDGSTMKVRIGDAIRNAAMRFGVALDLWIRGHSEDDEKRTVNDPPAPRRSRTQHGPSGAPICPLCQVTTGDGRPIVRFNSELVHTDCKKNAMAGVEAS